MVEAGWVIEHRTSQISRPSYWTGDGWSFDSMKAVRFVRQVDGENTDRGLGNKKPHRVLEHIWGSDDLPRD